MITKESLGLKYELNVSKKELFDIMRECAIEAVLGANHLNKSEISKMVEALILDEFHFANSKSGSYFVVVFQKKMNPFMVSKKRLRKYGREPKKVECKSIW